MRSCRKVGIVIVQKFDVEFSVQNADQETHAVLEKVVFAKFINLHCTRYVMSACGHVQGYVRSAERDAKPFARARANFSILLR